MQRLRPPKPTLSERSGEINREKGQTGDGRKSAGNKRLFFGVNDTCNGLEFCKNVPEFRILADERKPQSNNSIRGGTRREFGR